MFSKAHKPVTESFVQEPAEKALLNTDDTRIWLEHLQTILENRKRGAAKAAVTRQAKKKQPLLQNVPEVRALSTIVDMSCTF